MQTYSARTGLIEEESRDRFSDVSAEFFPIIGLSKNVVRKAFSHKPTVFLLRHLKNQFHPSSMAKRGEGTTRQLVFPEAYDYGCRR